MKFTIIFKADYPRISICQKQRFSVSLFKNSSYGFAPCILYERSLFLSEYRGVVCGFIESIPSYCLDHNLSAQT